MRVVVRDLGHRFPGRPWLFRHLNATLLPGRIYAVTGPSGSGKSTLLGLLAGWDTPHECNVDTAEIAGIGWVFQNPHGTPRRTARDHVALPFLATGLDPREADERADALLRRFGLDGCIDQQFRRLSGGEAQRLMLARAFAANPALLLVDEPTAQLDPPTARSVNAAISRLASSGTVVVVATHDAQTRDSCTDHLDLTQFQVGERAAV